MQPVKAWSIRNKLVALVLVSSLPAFALMVWWGVEQRENEARLGEHLCSDVAGDFADQQETIAQDTRQLLLTLSYLPAVRRRDPEACNALLAKLLTGLPEYMNVLFTAPDGNVFASGKPLKNPISVEDRKFFKDAMWTTRFSAGEYAVSRSIGKPTFHFALPVLDESKQVLAVLQAAFELEHFQRMSSLSGLASKLPPEAEVVVTDHAGIVLYCSNPKGPRAGQPDRPELFQRMLTGDNRTFAFPDEDGTAQIGLCHRLSLEPGAPPYMYIRVGVPRAKLMAAANTVLTRNLTLLLLTVLLALAGAWWMGGMWIGRGLKTVAQTAERMAGGDLAARTGWKPEGDEVGKLAQAFDRMAESVEISTLALRQTEQQFRTIFNSVEDAILILDADTHTVINANEKSVEMFGYTLEELASVTLDAVSSGVPPHTRKEALEWMRRAQAGQTPLFEWQARAKSGKLFWAEVNMRKAELNGRERLLMVVRDVTEQRQMRERLVQAEKLGAIGQLAGGVAHDFNNQLASIMSCADLLAMSVDDPELKECVDIIYKSSQRGRDLTGQLLAFARRGKYLSVPVDVHVLIDEVIALLRHSIAKRIEIKRSFSANPAVTTGDPTQLQNAFLNLALNARDAMPDGGELAFATQLAQLDEDYCRSRSHELSPGTFIQISVTDTGTGMTQETLKHLFEPFFTTKGKGQGTGMGLAAVYGTVKSHHGAVAVYSEPGRGTTFKLFLPCAEAARAEPAAPVLVGMGQMRARVLFVDDDEAVSAAVPRLLKGIGCSVIAFQDGAAAVEHYRSHWRDIDLLILDMVMPHMGGREIFLAMKEINPAVKALLSSGFSINGEAQEILNLGVQGFLQKPFQVGELSQKVSEVLKPCQRQG